MTPASNAASIHQRILNKAASEHRPFNELLQYYANERFLYRLGESPHGKQFVLKGALVFLAWRAPLTRPTRDMDFLGYTSNSVDNLVHIVQDVCAQPVEADGMIFDPKSVQGEMIKEDADYQGVRISFQGFLGKAQIPMRLDVGFADVVTPSSDELELPTILDQMSKPCVRAYPPETVIAEKFQAMIALGRINSRMKDFYDIWFMARSMEFDFHLLRKAVVNTFERRKTAIPEEIPTALTNEFADQKQALWAGFLKKSQIEDAPIMFVDVIQVLKEFFNPVIHPAQKRLARWSPPVGWEA
ncbi:MAG TPA: nucleotidyl transferase AbiEii/AbiGii toxin family protein [Anaerolineaceae bacterium]|nr:nucleotidyl transferase AbiEii/AbiGii toxin family protein [Anaerolineaceae bacterium]